jgi:hypothetical protein
MLEIYSRNKKINKKLGDINLIEQNIKTKKRGK